MEKQKEYILCAAVHYDNGLEYNFQKIYGIKTGFVICGYRHPLICDILPFNPFYLKRIFADSEPDKIAVQKYEELKYKYGWQEDSLTRCETIQGFLTSKGRFVNRREAFQIALAAGQIDESAGVDRELFSEDLY